MTFRLRVTAWFVLVLGTLALTARAGPSETPGAAQPATTTAPPVVKVQVEGQEQTHDEPKGIGPILKPIADLLAAFAWPIVMLFAMFRFRPEIGRILQAIAQWIPRAKNLKVGPVEIALEQVAEEVKADPTVRDKATSEERQLAKFVAGAASAAPDQWAEAKTSMDNLASEYDLLRTRMAALGGAARKSSPVEIVQMNKIVAQMRALGIACKTFWSGYAKSNSQGDHLAAVVIAQMSPDPKYLDWLAERFQADRPFVFYHAALAVQDIADQCWTEARDRIIETAKRGLEYVEAYKSGEPDQKTVDLLRSIVQRA